MKIQLSNVIKASPLLFAGLIALSIGLAPMSASAYTAPPQDEVLNFDDKVTICHSTSAKKNFYVTNTPNANAIQNAHIKIHTGPVYDGVMEKGWGDIVPPFKYEKANGKIVQVEGLNWNEAGQTIYRNGCVVPTTDPETPVLKKCEAIPTILATNLNPNGWTLNDGAAFVPGGVKLPVAGE